MTKGLDQEPLNPSDTPKQLDDEHSDPQVVNSANIATKLDAESSDDSETKPDKAD